MQLKRVFSGIQPTGDIHLGNYLGAVKNWVDREKEYDNIFCVVNSHAITTPQDPKILREKTYELCAMLLACGLKDSTLFIQSEVQEHTSLSWLLTCITPMGDLNRMTQFKSTSAASFPSFPPVSRGSFVSCQDTKPDLRDPQQSPK